MATIEDVHAEAQALAGDVETAAKLAARLADLIAEATGSVAGFEEKAVALFSAGHSQLLAFEGKLNERASQIEAEAETIARSVSEAADHIEAEVHGLESDATQLVQAIDHAGTAGVDLQHAIDQASAELSKTVAAWGDGVTATIAELDQRVSEGEHLIGEFGAVVSAVDAQWRQFVQQLDQQLQDALKDIAGHVSQYLQTDLTELVHAFESQLHALLADHVIKPLTDLEKQAIHAIEQELTHIADEAIGALDHVLHDAASTISGANEAADAKQKLIHDIAEHLKSAFVSIDSERDGVRSIMSAVGIDI